MKKILSIILSLTLVQAFIPCVFADTVDGTAIEYTNQDYSENFSNNTSGNLTLAEKGLTDVTEREPAPYISTDGTLIIQDDWNAVTSVIYNPSYYYTENRYNVNISAKNEMGGTDQYITVYLNYKDSENYYAVKISGSKWENDAYTHRSYVRIVKCVNGTVTQLCDEVEDAISDGDFTADIRLTDNIIGVYENGRLVASAKDTGEVLSGGYVAFGTENSRGCINSINVEMLQADSDFSEDFSNADLSDGSWTGIVDGNATIEDGTLIFGNGQNTPMYKDSWTAYGNLYELSYKVYNYWSGRDQYIKSYFNYHNSDNHYYIGFSGGAYTEGAAEPWSERYLVVGKKINGTVSETEIALGKISSIQNIRLVSDDELIKVYVGGALVYEAEDSMNEFIGGYIGFSSNTGGYVDDVVLTHFESDAEYEENFDSNVAVAEGWTFYPGEGQTISAADGTLLIGGNDTYLSGKALYEGQKFRQGNYILNFIGDIYASGSNTMQILFNYTSDTAGYRIDVFGNETAPKLYKNGTEVTTGVTASALKGGYAPTRYKVIYNDGYIALFANGAKYLEYTDEQPVTDGYIGFGSGAAGVMIDNISVKIPLSDIMQDAGGASYTGQFDENMMNYLMSNKADKSAYLQDGSLVFGDWGDLQNCVTYFIGKEMEGSYIFDTKQFRMSGGGSTNTGIIVFNAKDAKNYYKLVIQGGEEGSLVLYKATDGVEAELQTSEVINSNSITRDIRIENRRGGQIVVTADQEQLINYIDETPIESGYIGYGTVNATVSVGGFEISSGAMVEDPAYAYDGETPVTTLAGMSGKEVTIKKRIINNTEAEESVIPIAAIKDIDGVLHAIGVGNSTVIPKSATGDEISVSVTVPENADKMDLYLYLWKDMDKLVSSDFKPECVVVGEARNLFIMGDSMCADYAESIPQQGWGFFLKNEFDEHINATNFAVGGYMTSSVLDETKKNNWYEIKAQINEGDYVLMGLGYNDRHDVNGVAPLTKEEYQDNLRLLYDECTELGATMIFVTPATDLWHYEEGVGMKNCGASIALEMKEVAEEKNAACLDLNTVLWDSYEEISSTATLDEAKDAYYLSRNYLAGLGIDPTTVNWNYAIIDAGEDLVHFNDEGAAHLSNLVKGLLAESGLRLGQFLK